MKKHFLGILSFFIIACAVFSVSAQNGKIISDEMHAVSLEGNLLGGPPKRRAEQLLYVVGFA